MGKFPKLGGRGRVGGEKLEEREIWKRPEGEGIFEKAWFFLGGEGRVTCSLDRR